MLAESFAKLNLDVAAPCHTLLADTQQVPIGHTAYSWGCNTPGAFETPAAAAHIKGTSEWGEWPPSVGTLLQCVVVLAAGSVDWSSGVDSNGPHRFRSRKLSTLADLHGIALLENRDFPSPVAQEHCHPPYATWRMRVASANQGRLHVYLQSASSLQYLCRFPDCFRKFSHVRSVSLFICQKYKCVCTHIYIYIHMYICIRVNIYTYLNVYIYLYICIRINMGKHLSIYVSMC